MNHDINNIEFETFQNVMISVLNKHAPMKQKHIRANHAAFVTKELRKAIMKRTRLRNIFLKKRSENSKALYNKQRNICVSLTRKAKKSYYGNLDAKSVSDNKIFWKRISPLFSNKIKAKEKITLVENEKIISNDLEIANTFNNYFGKIVQNLDIPRNRNHISNTHLAQVNPVLGCIEKFSEHTSIKNIKNRMSNLNCNFKFEYEDKDFFQKEIENLCIKKATQQSDIPVRIMKENNDLCSYILHHSFNNSVSSSVFPNDLKKADITPIYKKDEKFLMTNYRPVSILPNVSKLFERSMFNQISTYFEKLFSKFQCGFRKGYNAQHSLLVLIENIRKILDKKGFAGIVLTDLSKAFDCIDHDLLIAKLQAYGFSIDSLKFIHSYLSDRIQRVKINSSFSKWHKIEFGVPQGSILGPLLFNIFICDLFFGNIQIDIANYADDTTPYAYDFQAKTVISALEENVNNLFDWFSDNYMKANADKCHLLTNISENASLSIKNENISNSLNKKLLGIRFKNNFCFDDHVAYLCKKASQKLNALARIAHFMNINQRRLIMKAFICSQFSYCPLIWMFHSRQFNNRINSLHERALRIVYRDYTSSFKELLKKDNSVTVHQKNLQVLATEIFKTKNGLNPEIMQEVFKFNEHNYGFRSATELVRTNMKTVKYGTETVTNLGAKIWDLVPSEYKELKSIALFKSKISLWETDNCPCRLCKTYIQNIGFI